MERNPEPSSRLLGRLGGYGAGCAYARPDRGGVSAWRSLFLHPFHAQLGTLARAADFLQRPDLFNHCCSMALDRGTSLARISLVLFHQ